MEKSQLDARTYGIGQLITQRKLFVVPAHQRSYSWSIEQVEQYLDDINAAIQAGARDYFVGLVVLQGPIGGIWTILDGQQRLATTTMIYSAIRNWLSERSLDPDAKQIEGEFIGVRQLGGNFSARLGMNLENRADFDAFVVKKAPPEQMKNRIRSLGRGSSNARLLDAAITCRNWIEDYAKTKSADDPTIQASALFELARFLENGVKIVCVDVASDADAYTLFEVLNDRGADLSALDLVKNHIFGTIEESNQAYVETLWGRLIAAIDVRRADDFLKVFWTSRFGVIQKSEIYRRIKEAYQKPDEVCLLMSEFVDAAEKLKAIDDPADAIWMTFPPEVKDFLIQIDLIGSRQVRPVILSALQKMQVGNLPHFLWMLIVVLVRYQVIGQGRTGVLEKELGRLSTRIWTGEVASSSDAWKELGKIVPRDVQFRQSFQEHLEGKASRVRYLLAAINQHLSANFDELPIGPQVGDILASGVVSVPIFKIENRTDALKILEQALVEPELAHRRINRDWDPATFADSRFPLTRRLGAEFLNAQQVQPHEASFFFKAYFEFAAESAVRTWQVEA